MDWRLALEDNCRAGAGQTNLVDRLRTIRSGCVHDHVPLELGAALFNFALGGSDDLLAVRQSDGCRGAVVFPGDLVMSRRNLLPAQCPRVGHADVVCHGSGAHE